VRTAHPKPPVQRHGTYAANGERLTETTIIELTVPMASKLFWAARQLRDPSGKPTPPSALARMLMVEAAGIESGARELVREHVKPDYYDGVPFLGRVTQRVRYKPMHPFALKMTFSQRDAVYRYCASQNTTLAALLRTVIERDIPAPVSP
jgi:hypothetical protein